MATGCKQLPLHMLLYRQTYAVHDQVPHLTMPLRAIIAFVPCMLMPHGPTSTSILHMIAGHCATIVTQGCLPLQADAAAGTVCA